MLELNGYMFKSGQEELVTFGLKIDNERLSADTIASWLKAHVAPVSRT